jgi:hypothetical protein
MLEETTMGTRSLSVAALLTCMAIPLAACSSASKDGAGTGGSGSGSGGSAGASLCDTDPRAETYAVGLSAMSTGGTMKVTFVDATPAPPAESTNVWTMKITDAKGNAVDGATVTLKPWMPDMGHGSSVTPQIMAMGGGIYQVTLVDLFMPGIWSNTFTITVPSEPVTTAAFTFCVDG